MFIKYGCPYWGNEAIPPNEFIKKTSEVGFKGVEFFLIPQTENAEKIMYAIAYAKAINPDFFFSLLQLNITTNERPEEHIEFLKKNLPQLAALNPDFINCHTGRDFFSFDDNCRIIDTVQNIAHKLGVRILHETHRSRFSFHAPTLIPYLERFPEMELVGDFSHFTVVGESMLEHNKELLEKIYPHVSHIHARIGYEQGPQINDPSAPEWESHSQQFLDWWKRILHVRKSKGQEIFTITPEFGPPPYLPCEPFTKLPLSNPFESNVFMFQLLQENFGLEF